VILACGIPLRAQAAAAHPSLFPIAPHWSVDIGAPPVNGAPPVSDADRIYVALRTGHVVARALASGAELWNRELATNRAIAVDGGLVFVAGDAALHALRGTDGAVVWEHATAALSAPLLAQGGWLIIATGRTITAMRGADGTVVWQRELGTVVHRPAIDGNRLFVPMDDGRLVALDLENGTSVWERMLDGAPGEPLATSDRIYVGAADRRFYSLKADNGDFDWSWRVGATVLGPPATDGARVFFVALDNVVRGLDRYSGVQAWQHAIRSRPAAPPAVVQGIVLIASATSPEITAWTAEGKPAGTVPLASPPVVAPDLAGGDVARLSVVTGSLARVYELTLMAAAPDLPLVALTELPGKPLDVTK